MHGGSNGEHVQQRGGSRARPQAAIEQRLGPIHDDFAGIEIIFVAQAVALAAGAIHAVEAEGARLQLRHVDAAHRAGQLGGIKLLLATDHGDEHQAAGQLHGQGHGIFQPLLDARLHQQAIDHHFDGVVLALVELRLVFQVEQLAINAGAVEAMRRQFLHLFFEFALASAHDGRQHHDAVFRLQRHHALHDLLG